MTPPTPTIEEQLDKLLENWLDEAMGSSLLSVGIDGYKGSEDNIEERRSQDYNAAKEKAKEQLTLLITKARIDEGIALWERIVPTVTNLDDTEYNAIKNAIYTRRQELKATTQKDQP